MAQTPRNLIWRPKIKLNNGDSQNNEDWVAFFSLAKYCDAISFLAKVEEFGACP